MNTELNQKIAVIGCGHWGKNLVRNFAGLGALEAVCDPVPQTAEKYAAEYNVEALSLQGILESQIQSVAIAAPAELHYKLARQALSAGKHVFVEKPLALVVPEAEELCQLASRRDLTLMVGHLLQYHPAFRKIKEMIQEGVLGRLQYIYSNRLSLGKIRREENSLWSFAPHDLSMILSLVGEEPRIVKATGGAYLHEILADVTTTHLAFPSGVRAHVFVSWLHPFKEQKLVVVGAEGMAVFDDTEPWERKILHYAHKIEFKDNIPVPAKAEPQSVELEPDEPLKQECLHFLECVSKGETPRTDGWEGVRVLKVLQQAQDALDQERRT